MRPRLEDLDYWTEGTGLGPVLRDVMSEDYADADDVAYEDALDAVLGEMSTAEGFSFSKALRDIQSGAGRLLSDPIVGQIAGAALPVGAGALGTLIGGPAGTAIGSRLGTLAAGALAPPGGPPKAPGQPPAVPTAPASPVAGGSAAAMQAALVTRLPNVVKAMVAAGMGKEGARQVDGIPVASIMNMLSAIFGQAAADADELAYLDDAGGEDNEEAYSDPAIGTGRSLYTALMDTENEEFLS